MENELVAIYVKIEELYCSYSSSPPSLSCFQAIFCAQGIRRDFIGNYSCSASNDIGEGSGNTLSLDIKCNHNFTFYWETLSIFMENI